MNCRYTATTSGRVKDNETQKTIIPSGVLTLREAMNVAKAFNAISKEN